MIRLIGALVRLVIMLIVLGLGLLWLSSRSASAQPSVEDLGVKPHVQVAAEEFATTFPGIASIGGFGPGSVSGSDHPKRLALDLMVGTDRTLGTRVADYAVANAERLNITYVIWDNRQWRDGAWVPYTGDDPHTNHPHISFAAIPAVGATPPGAPGDVVTGATAGPTAQPAAIPFGDCREAPAAEYPGAGAVGRIDPPDADQGVPGSAYHEVGYGGHVWHTYDLGCGPDAAVDPVAVGDSWFGNALFDGAKFVVAATVAINDAVTVGGLLDQLDGLLVSGTIALYDGVFVPLVGLALLLLAVMLLVLAFRGDLAMISRKTLVALVGLGLASMAYLTPLLYVAVIDRTLTAGMHALRTTVLTESSVDARHGLSQTLHEEVVYTGWLRGQFGSADSGDARDHGRELLRAQAFTRAEVAAGATGEQASEAKQERFEQVASSVAPATYPYLTGHSAHRTGAGLFALLESLVYASFQAAAGLAIFVCLLLLRMLVLLGPVLGLVAILRHRTLAELGQAAGTAVWQAIVLTVVATLHLVMMVHIAGLALPGIGALLLMLAATVVLWWAVGPWRRLRSMVSVAAAVTGAEVSAGPSRRGIDASALRAALREASTERRSVPYGDARPEGSSPVSATAERLPDPPARPEQRGLPTVVEGGVGHPAIPLSLPVSRRGMDREEREG